MILGNPPYSGISANINKWTKELLKTNIDGAQSYYEMDGQPLGEKKLWLQNDYVKFLRFAQWKIHRAGEGVVGMITDHSYLSSPTFRGMRESLTKTFNEIYIIDLHGSSLKNETSPDGSKDENVFDIRQGTAIGIMIKNKKEKAEKCITVICLDLNKKYDWLQTTSFKTKDYAVLKPKSSLVLFY